MLLLKAGIHDLNKFLLHCGVYVLKICYEQNNEHRSELVAHAFIGGLFRVLTHMHRLRHKAVFLCPHIV